MRRLHVQYKAYSPYERKQVERGSTFEKPSGPVSEGALAQSIADRTGYQDVEILYWGTINVRA